MLAAIIGFFTALPELLKTMKALTAAVEAHTKELEANRIERARVDGNQAQTDEERIKAAREAQDANRHL